MHAQIRRLAHPGTLLGAPEWTRTTTPFRAQALNLPRIPFRHGGLLARRAPPHPAVYTAGGPLSTASERHCWPVSPTPPPRRWPAPPPAPASSPAQSAPRTPAHSRPRRTPSAAHACHPPLPTHPAPVPAPGPAMPHPPRAPSAPRVAPDRSSACAPFARPAPPRAPSVPDSRALPSSDPMSLPADTPPPPAPVPRAPPAAALRR